MARLDSLTGGVFKVMTIFQTGCIKEDWMRSFGSWCVKEDWGEVLDVGVLKSLDTNGCVAIMKY